jgi:hypothetical protein
MIPPKLRVKSYPVMKRGNFVWVWMGDAAKADPALIMDLPYLDDPKWKGIPADPKSTRMSPSLPSSSGWTAGFASNDGTGTATRLRFTVR